MKNVLFFGGSSLLATIWANNWKGSFNIFMTTHKQLIEEGRGNIIKIKEISEVILKKILLKNKIDLLINCVGLTNVEECEKDPLKANYLNAEVPLILAKTCFQEKVKLIHISTDHLFNGTKELSSELDIPVPLNQYAKTKLKGDQNVANNNPDSLIIRTNFFGIGPNYKPSFSDFITNALDQGEEIELFEDVFFTPIHVNEIARIIIELLKNKEKGIFNIASDERISKYEFGLMIARIMNFSPLLIKKGSIGKREDLVKRPKDMSLSNNKTKEKLNIEVKPIIDQIKLLRLNK
tara:strand:- start:3789 stop:4667 length:879 start_codon:yes stop_codon:yes gene_type:complete